MLKYGENESVINWQNPLECDYISLQSISKESNEVFGHFHESEKAYQILPILLHSALTGEDCRAKFS